MIAGETQDVGDIKGCCAQNIALKSDAISITCHHLQHRIQSHELETYTGCQAAHTGNGCLVVRDIYSIHMILDHFRLLDNGFRITASWRTTL